MSDPWFAIDKAGLAALTARRDKSFLFAEALANSWDAPGTSRVDVITTRTPGRPEAEIRFVDDSPEGFVDLSHAFTLFATTDKRANAEQRGRFNLGEKLSLAVAKSARITSTKGTLTFDASGRRRSAQPRTTVGTEISLLVPITAAELDAAVDQVMTYIAPVPTFINGVQIPARTSLTTFQAKLPTELQGEDGNMRRTERITDLTLYPAAAGAGRLYELGIPVCETGDTFDVDIGQKVPLSLERESVTDAYLRRVRAAVLANAAHLLDESAAKTSWVTAALEAENLPDHAVAAVIRQRYGDKAVIFDPSDPEANKIAVSRGYTVVHGGAFSGAAWTSIRDAGALKPAGQVTPSPSPWAESGTAATPIAPDADMARFAAWCVRLGEALLGVSIAVEFYARFNDPQTAAAYGGRRLQLSTGRLGRAWFRGPLREEQLDLVLHEFGHHYSDDHLSRDYYKALTRLGAKAAFLALTTPCLFAMEAEESLGA